MYKGLKNVELKISLHFHNSLTFDLAKENQIKGHLLLYAPQQEIISFTLIS